MFVGTIEKRRGQKIACIEKIAYCMGYIYAEQLQGLAELLKNKKSDISVLQKLFPKGR